LEQTPAYVYHESFEDPALEDQILAPMPGLPEYEAARARMQPPGGAAPPELAALYRVPLLNREQERHLFRKMNFLKHKVNQIRQQLHNPTGQIGLARIQADRERIDKLFEQANAIKDQLIQCNMRLVVAIARRYAWQIDDLFGLISEGNVVLIRTIEHFEFSRGNKFSTYASWSLKAAFGRSLALEKTRRQRYLTGREGLLGAILDPRADLQDGTLSAEDASFTVNRLLRHLPPRERRVIRMRAGLDNGSDGMTLQNIGEQLGISKERVRQLNSAAMKRLRRLARVQRVVR
jgi:RNA polymerase sigma factor (sigma-70 family)